MRRGPSVLLLFALLIGSAYGAQRALSEGWARVTGFSPAVLNAANPATGPSPMADRLVLIMVDGLRPEDATLLPSLDWLQRQGARYTLSVPAPAYQTPVSATLLTGALPTAHGILRSESPRPLAADSLPAAARRAGISAGGTGIPALGALLGPAVETWYPSESPGQVPDEARSLLAAGGPRLVLVQTEALQAGARRIGTADRERPEYKDLLADLDVQLVEMLSLVDLKTTAVMVVGTVPIDSDGARSPEQPVPLIMAGPGVKAGARGEARLTDVAPTAAALIGAPTPVHNQGRPLLAALRAEGRPADVVVQRYLASRKAVADASLRAFGSAEMAPDPPPEAKEAAAYEGQLDLLVRQARLEAAKRSLLDRLPYLGGALFVLLLYLIIVFRQPYGGVSLLGTLTYAGVFHLTFFLTGGRYGADMAALDAPDRSLAVHLFWQGAAAMGAAAAVTGLVLSRRSFKKSSYLTAAICHMALSTSALLALPVAVMLAFVGWDFPVTLPAPGLLVWYFVTALQLIAIGYLSPASALVSVVTFRLAQRLWPLKEVGDPERNADKVVRLRALRRHSKNLSPKG